MQKTKAQGKDNIENWWLSRPWRQIQTNLREIDMIDIDSERFVSDLKEFNATSVMVNAAGIIASYPTKLPFHFQSPYLQGDSLEQIITACHREDIAVIARTDFSKVRRPIYEANPEWAYVSQNGEIIDYNGDVHVCINGEYQQKYALEIIYETLTTLDFDGIFFNMGGYRESDYSYNYYGICHCHNCQRKFEEMYGLSLPLEQNMNDPVFQKYVLFKRKTVQDHAKLIYDFIRSIRSNICISNNLIQKGIYRQESNTALVQYRPLPHWQYSGSDNTKYVVSSYDPMVSVNTTVDFIDYAYRHVAVSPHQQVLRLAQNLANGGGLDYYLIGRLDNHEDKSGYEGIKQMFQYHAENEHEYEAISSKANIGIIQGPDANVKEFRGWYRFLTENHYLFDTIMMNMAMELSWDKYKAIIVPDYQPVSDELARKLDSFVEAGGTVISVSRSGFQHDNFANRSVPAFRSLGMNKINSIRKDMTSSMFKISNKQYFTRFPVTDLIYMDENYVYAEYDESVIKHLSLIPPHMFGPPERCYYTQVTDHPGFTINRYGKGRAIYIPWEPGSLFYKQGHTNTFNFVADLLENAAGLKPVGGNIPPVVETTVFAKEDGSSQLIHLVNGSGHHGVTFFEPLTLNELEVSIPYDGEPREVTSLVTKQAYQFKQSDGMLTVQIPQLKAFDAIKIVS